MNKFSIGVDLGGTNLRIAAVDEQGNLIEKVTLGTKVSLGRDHVINDMCDAIQRMVERFRESAPLLGIGVGVPGIIDMQTGLLRESPNLPGWADYPVRAEIERRLKTVVILENDANVAALGEKWLGAARDYSDMAMLTLGTGVGGGLVLGGRIWRGANGMATEFGHITVEPEGHLCGCGNHGCVEQYASATAVVRMAREAAAGNAGSALARAAGSDPEFSAKSIYNLAIQGDEDARRVFREAGRYLGIALAGLINSLNLPIYVIGGGASSAWDAFAPALFEELRRRSYVYAATAPHDPATTNQGASARLEASSRKTIITRALLGSDAGLYGAARLPMIEQASR
jgi:glucokinase